VFIRQTLGQSHGQTAEYPTFPFEHDAVEYRPIQSNTLCFVASYRFYSTIQRNRKKTVCQPFIQKNSHF